MKQQFIVSVLFGLCFSSLISLAQYAPPAGQAGTTAMYKDSSAFVSWANNCHIGRGLQDVSVPSGDYANVGDSSCATGIAGTSGVVSLGDGGFAVLQFNLPIIDGPGPDFAVFENGFDDFFLELAIVEVSSDGIHYFRFPAASNTDTAIQIGSFGLLDASKINNLAGKYRAPYGTPFDLVDIPDDALLNKQAITHVKIIDVVGCIQNQYCTRDANNHKINDPWPTAFGSGGFDLDAVGVIHEQALSVNELELINVTIFPNPVIDEISINVGSREMYSVYISNLLGELVYESVNESHLNLSQLKKGVFILTIRVGEQQKQIKFIKS